MKIYITIICCLISFLLLCQTGSIYLGLGASYERVEYEFHKDIFNAHIDYENENRMSSGLTFGYQPSDNLMLSSGALLSRQEITLEYNWITIDQLDPILPKNTTIKASYLRVPLTVGWIIESGKFEFLPSLGFNFDFLMSSSERTISEGNIERESDFYKPDFTNPHTFFTLDLLLGFNATEKIIIGVAPYLNQALSAIDNQNIDTPEANVGGRLNISYKLK
jgi:hypothetical protein